MLGFSPINSVSFTGKMLTTDLDGTMLIPSNEHMKIDVEDRLYSESSIQKTEEAVKRNGIDSVLLNTGRNFTELKEVQDLLEKTTLPVTAISLEDGKRLLTKPEEMSSNEWIKSLFDNNINYLKFKDEAWSEKTNAPIKAIGQFLTKEKGYIHRNDKGENLIYSKPIKKGDTGVKKANKEALWIVTLVPPGIDFEVSVRNMQADDDIDVEAYNKEISKEIFKMLQDKGFSAESPETKQQVTYLNSIERKDVSKGSVADYVREMSGDTDSEIRAGNAGNDESMLITSKPKTQCVLVGEDKVLKSALAPYKNVTYVQAGDLGEGIDAACKKLNLLV